MKTYDFRPSALEIEIKTLGKNKRSTRIFPAAHRTTFFELLFLEEWRGNFKIDFQDVTLGAGDIFVILTNQVCEFDFSDSYQGKMILFTYNFFAISENDASFLYSAEFLSLANLSRTVNTDVNAAKKIFSLLENELQSAKDIYQSTVCQSLLRVLLLQCERKFHQTTKPLTANIAKGFFNLVEKNFTAKRNIDFYVGQLGVSENRLAKEVKTACNLTLKTYINNRLLLEAKRLLRFDTLSAKEIAFNLGFDDTSNFSNWFKKQTGKTPLQFKHKKA
ncbi:MAG: helix-turn-helix transcriptional regulator [Bacteroidales bacterium]|nr:helix-turn-helix transcriptional regulator [Bacteroidales bacterium]